MNFTGDQCKATKREGEDFTVLGSQAESDLLDHDYGAEGGESHGKGNGQWCYFGSPHTSLSSFKSSPRATFAQVDFSRYLNGTQITTP
jgi:hypothetical protein